MRFFQKPCASGAYNTIQSLALSPNIEPRPLPQQQRKSASEPLHCNMPLFLRLNRKHFHKIRHQQDQRDSRPAEQGLQQRQDVPALVPPMPAAPAGEQHQQQIGLPLEPVGNPSAPALPRQPPSAQKGLPGNWLPFPTAPVHTKISKASPPVQGHARRPYAA